MTADVNLMDWFLRAKFKSLKKGGVNRNSVISIRFAVPLFGKSIS
jgi:hypothetical protein